MKSKTKAEIRSKSPIFQKTVFPNGLTVVTERHPSFRSLAIGVWVRKGTRDEARSEAGMSHFLEHMMFKGTEKRSALDIARAVDRVGGEFNAFTARDHTCFHLLLLDRDLGLGLELLTDILLSSTFDANELERERRVILQEVTMVEESPEETAHDLFFAKGFGAHPIGRPILGSTASIKRFRRSDVQRFFDKHYRPEEIVISVAGNVTHEQVKKGLARLSRGKWGRKATSPEVTHTQPPQLRPGFWWAERPAEQVHLIWGVPGPTYGARDRFSSFLLNVYLGGGMSSSLFQEIREKNGLAYTVYSALQPFTDSGVFSIYAATNLNQVPLCLALIERSVEQVQKTLLTSEELTMIQDNLKGSILLASDDVESRMSSIAKNEIFLGRYVPVEEVCRAIDSVTVEDIRRVARRIFHTDRRSILALGPKPSALIRKKLKPTRI